MKSLFTIACTLVCTFAVFAEDEKIKDKVFMSRNNQIQTIQTSTLSNTKYLVLRLIAAKLNPDIPLGPRDFVVGCRPFSSLAVSATTSFS